MSNFKTLLEQKCNLDYQSGLMESMVFSNYQSLSVGIYHEKRALQNQLNEESQHADFKMKNCLACDNVLSCSVKTKCSKVNV